MAEKARTVFGRTINEAPEDGFLHPPASSPRERLLRREGRGSAAAGRCCWARFPLPVPLEPSPAANQALRRHCQGSGVPGAVPGRRQGQHLEPSATPRSSPHPSFSLRFTPKALPRLCAGSHRSRGWSCPALPLPPLCPMRVRSAHPQPLPPPARPQRLQPLTQELHGEVARLGQQAPADDDFFGRVESVPHDERDTCGGEGGRDG